MRSRPKLTVLAIVLVAVLAFPFTLPAAGRWLVVEDPRQPARAMEAAALYTQGWAREVWLTQGTVHEEDLALERLGIERTPEHEYSRQVLMRSAVPEEAIRLLPEAVENTAAEVRAVAAYLKGAGDGRVILITSKFHTRRVKAVWRSIRSSQTVGGAARKTPSRCRTNGSVSSMLGPTFPSGPPARSQTFRLDGRDRADSEAHRSRPPP